MRLDKQELQAQGAWGDREAPYRGSQKVRDSTRWEVLLVLAEHQKCLFRSTPKKHTDTRTSCQVPFPYAGRPTKANSSNHSFQSVPVEAPLKNVTAVGTT